MRQNRKTLGTLDARDGSRMNKLIIGKKISIFAYSLINTAFRQKRSKTEIQEEVDFAYSSNATPLARFSVLQTNMAFIVIFGMAIAVILSLATIPFISIATEMNWPFLIGMVSLPFVLTGGYFYARLAPVEKKFNILTVKEDNLDAALLREFMFYDKDYYIAFSASIVVAFGLLAVVLL